MEISQTIQDRIFAAADELYAEGGGNTPPTVDAVRRRARVNMNDARACMKEWRQKQRPAFTPIAVQLPGDLQATWTSALAQLWQQALSLSNEPLRAAHAGWELERARASDAERELAAAYDQQSAELTAAHDEVARLSMQADQLRREATEKSQALVTAEQARLACNIAVREADVRSVEIERRATELRKELDHAHTEIANLRQSHADEMARLAAEAKNDVLQERGKAEQAQLRHGTALLAAQLENASLRGSLRRSAAASKTGTRKRKVVAADDAKAGQNMTLPNV